MIGASALATAQQDVYLRFMHMYDGSPFTTSTIVSTPSGDNMQFNRMEYYVSGLTLYHDGGQAIDLSTTYLLVNATTPEDFNLGSHSITQLDSIRFAIGVDAASNHDDPASYTAGHPLAPRSPSMHWGWSAGYRFVCLEGEYASAAREDVQVHALGDANYFYQTIATSGSVVDGNLIIQLDADYQKTLSTVSVTGGLIVHGDYGAAVTVLDNFRDSVYTASAQNVSGIGIDEYAGISSDLYPNPAMPGEATLHFDAPAFGSVKVMDLTGRTVYAKELFGEEELRLDVQHVGVYLVQTTIEGETSAQRLVISE